MNASEDSLAMYATSLSEAVDGLIEQVRVVPDPVTRFHAATLACAVFQDAVKATGAGGLRGQAAAEVGERGQATAAQMLGLDRSTFASILARWADARPGTEETDAVR